MMCGRNLSCISQGADLSHVDISTAAHYKDSVYPVVALSVTSFVLLAMVCVNVVPTCPVYDVPEHWQGQYNEKG
jgi:hypothetical protein